MHKNSKFTSLTSFQKHLVDQHGVSNDIIKLSKIIVNDIKMKFGLDNDKFSLGKSKILTYYNQSNLVFGNIRFNKKSLKVQPIYSGDNKFPVKHQADKYSVHSFKLNSLEEYISNKEDIMKLIKGAYDK